MAKTGSKHTKKSMSEYCTHSDKELVDLAIDGVQKAFAELVRRYNDSLIQYLDNFLKIKKGDAFFAESAEEAQDICQEAMQKAFKNLDNYNSIYSFSTWLYNIAKNTAIDYFRKRRIDVELDSVNDYKIMASGGNSEDSPEEKMISGQTYSSLIDKINKLPELYRTVAKLRFIEEYAIEEISEKLEIPANTVKTRIKRAKEQLSKQLDK
jgi:RNA polymerase sigma-70 factor, ECF subfamily